MLHEISSHTAEFFIFIQSIIHFNSAIFNPFLSNIWQSMILFMCHCPFIICAVKTKWFSRQENVYIVVFVS